MTEPFRSLVADKFRPVKARAFESTPPWVVGLALVGLAGGLFLWEAEAVDAWVDDQQLKGAAWAGPARSVTGPVREAARLTGVTAARDAVDGFAAPLQRTARVFEGGPNLAPPPPPRQVSGRRAAGIGDTAEAEADSGGDGAVLGRARWIDAADHPDRVRRVLLVGASSIQYYLGVELERALEEGYDGLTVHRKGKLGTGLVRDDVFDWQAEIEALLARHRPDVVLLQFGGNDAQPLTDAAGERHAFGTEGWQADYRRRLGEVVDAVKAAGAHPVFLGMPVMRESGFDGRMERLDGWTHELAAERGAGFVAVRDLSANPDGSYRVDVRHEGRAGAMRLPDGIHFKRLGAQYVADHLVERLEREVLLVPADRPPADEAAPPRPLAVAHGGSWASSARGQRVPYLAYVPQDPPAEGLPALFLLHGAYGSWTSWADHAHDRLAALAQDEQLVIVLPDGEPHGWYLGPIGASLRDELVDHVRATLPVLDPTSAEGQGQWGIAGLSMGGHGAINLALDRPEVFSVAWSMSGAVDLPHAKSRQALKAAFGPYGPSTAAAWEARSVVHRVAREPGRARRLTLRVDCGTDDRVWIGPNERLHQTLSELGIEHSWQTVPGGHTWDVWTGQLEAHGGWLGNVLHGAERPASPAEP